MGRLQEIYWKDTKLWGNHPKQKPWQNSINVYFNPREDVMKDLDFPKGKAN